MRTSFAVITPDGNKEWGGTKKGFVDSTIPHKGLRYKTFSGALGTADRLSQQGCATRVIETLI